MSGDIYLPDHTMEAIAAANGIPVYKLFPQWFAERLISLSNAGDADDLCYRLGGRGARPNRDIALVGADGKTPILILADDQMEASEIEELVLETYERQSAKLAAGVPIIDFAAHRQKRGLPPKEKVGGMVAQAIQDRMEQHRRNPITDPPRKVGRTRGYVQGASRQEAEVAG